MGSDRAFSIADYCNGTCAGLSRWNGDPVTGVPNPGPGNAFRVLDRLSDG
ncbi:hypothetical protein P1P68_04820 [Streptomyces scabiei]|nr:hypothetical protein [Streptomyces scabiei]MDW8804132.1 hypothetical protein [Streptomyces scabiei]